MTQQFVKTRVVTRNVIIDWFQHVRNLFGWRLLAYKEILQRHMDELISEAQAEFDVEWWKVDVDPMTPGSAIITVYGEGEPR